MKTLFVIYIVGLRRSSGIKSGKFIWSDKHQKHIYEGRELELEEFNTLMEGQWPMQKLAHQQVSGFAFIEEQAAEILSEETESEQVADETPADEVETEQEPETLEDSNESPADEAPSDDEHASDDDETTIPRNPRKGRKPKN